MVTLKTIAAVVMVSVALCMVGGSLQAQEAAVPELQALGTADSPYTLGIGDVVDILVRNQPEFSDKYIVGPDGNIQYAFVGDIKAEGLTKYQLKDAVGQYRGGV